MTNYSLPEGWEAPCNNEYIAKRQIEDFTYAKIRYDADKNQYVVETVNCDGPKQITPHSRHGDLEAAFRSGNKL